MNNKVRPPRRLKGLVEVSLRVRDLDAMQKFYEEVVGKVTATVHEWLHVRSLYFPDPERCPEPVEEGNLLEFVCYDASVG